jgi:hypothetical protein
MASFLYGPLIADARGSIKGTTFSHAKSGPTGRGRPHPPYPRRTEQQNVQDALRTASSAWFLVTPSVKSDWTTYAASVTLFNRLFQAFTPTGQMMFMRSAVLAKLYGPYETPPVYRSAVNLAALPVPTAGGLPTAPTPAFSLVSNNLKIDHWISAPPSPSTTLLFIYRPSTTPQASRRFLFARKLVLSTDTPPITIATGYTTGIPASTLIHCMVRYTLVDGNYRVSNPTTNLFDLTT